MESVYERIINQDMIGCSHNEQESGSMKTDCSQTIAQIYDKLNRTIHNKLMY